LPLGARDELAVLFARINQATARLARRRDAVARDRARLEAIVDERTAALREANARLERADTDRRRFFADVGHELRSPLTVILAEAELAAGATEDPALREALATIRTRALRLNRRVDDLLRIARSESGQLGLDRRPVDLAAVARLAADDLAPLVRKAGARVDFADTGEAFVIGDPDWLRQIAGGLIGNALKHGGPGVAVRLTTGVGSDGTFLEVTDDGPGLPEDDHARVLARFGQGRPEDPATRRAGGGFGIGLTLARWVAEAHGGRLDLRSPVANGRGLAVRVTLPDSAVAGHPVPHRREEGADAAYPGR
jgi:signal transduction histidine kinase